MPSTKEYKVPVIVFTYNRPGHANRALESLARCTSLERCQVYIHSDGPRLAAHKDAVLETRRLIKYWAQKLSGVVIEQQTNKGLSRAIVEGVTDLCERYGRAIVIEDDIIVRPDFIVYLLSALDRYAEQAQVMQISAYTYPVSAPCKPDGFFLPLTSGWGWATWKRAWQQFDWNARGAVEKLCNPVTQRRFDVDNSYPYTTLLYERLAGRNESWGILWQWTVFNSGGLVLFPRRSLVWNGGFDGSGTHAGTRGVEGELSPDFSSPGLAPPIDFPKEIVLNESMFREVAQFLRRKMGYPVLSLRERVTEFLKRQIAGQK